MGEESVNSIRETSRNLLIMNRRNLKDEDTDVRRSLANMRISCNVADIANKLKTKSAVSALNLQELKNTLMADPKNAKVVLNTNGALRGLVREISGHDVSKQCAAAGCLCNLSLGNARGCTAVAKAAGPYLITALGTLTTELAVTCAWTLGNLAGSGGKACELLVLQGAIAKLADMLHAANDEQDAAVYALTHFAYMLKDDLRSEHFTMIIQKLFQTDVTQTSSQLLVILSCHKNFRDIPEKFLDKILQKLSSVLKQYLINKEDSLCSVLINLIRVIANSVGEYNSESIVSYFERNISINDFKKLLVSDSVQTSVLWLLGNLFKFCNDSVFFKELLIE